MRTFSGTSSLSPLGRVRILLSSSTLLRFSAHSGSTSPSKTIQCLRAFSPRLFVSTYAERKPTPGMYWGERYQSNNCLFRGHELLPFLSGAIATMRQDRLSSPQWYVHQQTKVEARIKKRLEAWAQGQIESGIDLLAHK